MKNPDLKLSDFDHILSKLHQCFFLVLFLKLDKYATHIFNWCDLGLVFAYLGLVHLLSENKFRVYTMII